MIKRLGIFILLLSSLICKSQVKPDFIRTPNTGNTIVDWNLKAKTFILPHFNKSTPPTYQDTIGAVFLNTDTTDKHIYFRYKMGTGGIISLGNFNDGVKSVGSGFGLLGGPITTTGTLIADTASSIGLVSKSRLKANLKSYQPNMNYVSVVDSGAVGNGTTDATVAFQKCLASGKNVYVPNGSYLISSTLKINNYQVLRGQSRNAEIKTNLNIVLITNDTTTNKYLNRAEIRDIKLTNAYPVTSGAGATNWTVKIINGLGCIVDNVYIQSNFADADFNPNNRGGIYIAQLTGSFCYLNQINNCLLQSSSIRMDGSDSWIANSYVWGHTNGVPTIDLEGSNINVYSCNGIIPSRYYGGVYLSPSSSQCTIEGNFFDGSTSVVKTGNAVVGSNNTDNKIVNNSFWNIYRGGVLLTDCSTTTISNNTFRNNNRADSSYSDITIKGVTYGTSTITANGNTFYRPNASVNKGYAIQEVNGGFAPALNSYSDNKINGNYLTPSILATTPHTIGRQGGSVANVMQDNLTVPNIGVGSVPVGSGSSNNVEFTQGSQIAGRTGFPQMYLSSNITGVPYSATRAVSGYGSQIVLDALGGTMAFNRAVTGSAGSAITWLSNLLFDNNGNATFGGTASISHIIGSSSAPTIAAGTGAGTTPTVSVSSATDMAGIINITTGTTPSGSNAIVATITFNAAYGVAPKVLLTPGNRNAQALATASQVLVPVTGQTNGVTTTTFVMESGATALAASTAYIWTYHVIQ